MRLVSYKGAQPQIIPPEHSNKSEEKLNELGFDVCPEKPEIIPGQILYWKNKEWKVREPNEAELDIQWQTVKNEAVRRLSETDYIIIKAYETSSQVDVNAITYRQALRDIYNNINNLNPFAIEWPIL